MSIRYYLPLALVLVTAAPLTVRAQSSTATVAPQENPAVVAGVPEGGVPRYIHPETPEQRRDRLGTMEDPGLDPDPTTIYSRFGREFTIQKFPKKWAKYTERPGFVRPLKNMNFVEELYQENEKFIWVWLLELPPPTSREERVKAAAYRKLSDGEAEFLHGFRKEFEPLEVPPGSVRVRFEESSNGLPTEGSFRNSPAVADMNGDGFMDLVIPPQRTSASNLPAIFLGDGKGNWKPWTIRWPVAMNYGGVVAADFNKDKKMDLAFAEHLAGVRVFLGDGKGAFRQMKQGLEGKFPTRRIVATDLDRDGWTDVVAISEGPVGRGVPLKEKAFGMLRGYLNRKKGEVWEGFNIAGPKSASSGDWLAEGDFNGDRFPDFATSSIFIGGTETIFMSESAGRYQPLDGKGEVIPPRSIYGGMAIGKFVSSKRDAAVVSFRREWVPKVAPDVVAEPASKEIYGLEALSFEGSTPVRTPIMRWENDKPIWGIASADFDGDRREDVLFTRYQPREAVLLTGDGKGGFARAAVEGLTLRPLRNYDLTVADVNGDARPDVIVMYEAESATAMARKNGRVHVFLNRGSLAVEK